jgi:predicted transposase YbfD/YdcC
LDITGHIETRTYFLTDKIDWLDKKADWTGLNSIGAVHFRIVNTSTCISSEETRYFISSLDAEVSRFAYAVRKHWGVENMHPRLDTIWNEDSRCSRKDNSAKNLSQLLRLAYDIIKSVDVPKRMPLKRLRKQAMADDKYLDKLVSFVF